MSRSNHKSYTENRIIKILSVYKDIIISRAMFVNREMCILYLFNIEVFVDRLNDPKVNSNTWDSRSLFLWGGDGRGGMGRGEEGANSDQRRVRYRRPRIAPFRSKHFSVSRSTVRSQFIVRTLYIQYNGLQVSTGYVRKTYLFSLFSFYLDG